VTGVTQSRAARSASNVSANPKPSGLTTPEPTMATRARDVFPFITVDVGISGFFALNSSLLYLVKTFTNEPQTKTEARKLVDCQLSLFSGDLKSDKREQS
jgi:hypothetical protein